MSQKQSKQAKREIRIFCEEQLRRTVNHEQPMDARFLGNYPARMVRKTVGQWMIDNDVQRIMRELGAGS